MFSYFVYCVHANLPLEAVLDLNFKWNLKLTFFNLVINVAINIKAKDYKLKIHISISLFLSQAALNDEQCLSKIKYTSFTQCDIHIKWELDWILNSYLSIIEVDSDHWPFTCNMATFWLNIELWMQREWNSSVCLQYRKREIKFDHNEIKMT